MRSPILAALLATLLLAGCGPEPPSSVVRVAHPATLNGTSWRLVEVGVRPLQPRPEITVEFGDGAVRGQLPCNTFAGSAVYDGSSGAIQISQLVTTKRACTDPELGPLETEVLEALRGARAVSIDESGRLVLTGPRTDLILVVAGQPVGPPIQSQAGPS